MSGKLVDCHNVVLLSLKAQDYISVFHSKGLGGIKMFKEEVKNIYTANVSYLNQRDEIVGFSIYDMIR